MDYRLNDDGSVTRTKDGAIIPNHPGNADWNRYLAWIAESESNIPDPVLPPVVDERAAARALTERRAAELEKDPNDLAKQVEALKLRLSLLQGD